MRDESAGDAVNGGACGTSGERSGSHRWEENRLVVCVGNRVRLFLLSYRLIDDGVYFASKLKFDDDLLFLLSRIIYYCIIEKLMFQTNNLIHS